MSYSDRKDGNWDYQTFVKNAPKKKTTYKTKQSYSYNAPATHTVDEVMADYNNWLSGQQQPKTVDEVMADYNAWNNDEAAWMAAQTPVQTVQTAPVQKKAEKKQDLDYLSSDIRFDNPQGKTLAQLWRDTKGIKWGKEEEAKYHADQEKERIKGIKKLGDERKAEQRRAYKEQTKQDIKTANLAAQVAKGDMSHVDEFYDMIGKPLQKKYDEKGNELKPLYDFDVPAVDKNGKEMNRSNVQAEMYEAARRQAMKDASQYATEYIDRKKYGDEAYERMQASKPEMQERYEELENLLRNGNKEHLENVNAAFDRLRNAYDTGAYYDPAQMEKDRQLVEDYQTGDNQPPSGLTQQEELEYNQLSIALLSDPERYAIEKIAKYTNEMNNTPGGNGSASRRESMKQKRDLQALVAEQVDLLKHYGWDDEKIHEYRLRAQRLINAEEAEEEAPFFEMSGNEGGLEKLGKSAVNWGVGRLESIPAVLSLGSVFEEKPEGQGRDPYSQYGHFKRLEELNDQEVLDKAIGDNGVGRFLYGASASMGDMGAQMLVAGGLSKLFGVAGAGQAVESAEKAGEAVTSAMKYAAGAEKAIQNLSLLSFGVKGYDSAYEQARANGASEVGAQLRGIAGGLAEIITEKISLDNLWGVYNDPNALKNVVKNVLRSGAIEGSEEIASDVVNDIADGLVSSMLRDTSTDFQHKVEAYMASGLSEEEAYSKAMQDRLVDYAYDGLAGALSGAGMGGAATIGSEISQMPQKRLQKQIETLEKNAKEARFNNATEEGVDLATQSIPELQAPENLNVIEQNAPQENAVLNEQNNTAERAAQNLSPLDAENDYSVQNIDQMRTDAYDTIPDFGQNDTPQQMFDKQVSLNAQQMPTDTAMDAYTENITSDMDVPEYTNAFNNIYTAGASGVNFDTAISGQNADFIQNELGLEKANNIYKAGQIDLQNELSNETINDLSGNQGQASAVHGEFKDLRTNKSRKLDTQVLKIIPKLTPLNIQIVDPDGSDVRGWFDPNTRTISVTADDANQMFHEAIAEVTKFYNSEGYAKLSQAISDAVAKAKGMDWYQQKVAAYKRAYGDFEGSATVASANQEFTNDALVSLFSTEEGRKAFADALMNRYNAQEAQSIIGKIKDVFNKIMKSLRSLLKNSNMNSAQKEIFEAQLDNQQQLIDMAIEEWEKALDNAERSGNTEGAKTQYSQTIDDLEDVNLSNTPLTKSDVALAHKGIFSKLSYYKAKNMNMNVTDVVTSSNHVFLFQNNSENSIDYEIIEIRDADSYTTNIHELNVYGGYFYGGEEEIIDRIDALSKSGQEDYSKGLNLLDRGGSDDGNADLSSRKPGSNRGTNNGYNGPNSEEFSQSINDEDVDTKPRFSLKVPVEESGDLIAVHNMTPDQLTKTLDLGGFPMPSIAITKADMGHDMYGNISIIFPKEVIDPKANRANKVYSGDAYTPEFPTVGYKINSDKVWNIEERLRDLIGDKYDMFGYMGIDPDNVSDRMDRNGGDFVDAYGNKEGLKYAFAKDTGNDIDVPMTDERLSSNYDNDEIIAIANMFTPEEALRIFQGGTAAYEELEKSGRIQDIINTLNKFEEEKYGKLKDGKLNGLYEKAKTKSLEYYKLDNIMNAVVKYNREGIKPRVDHLAFSNAIDDFINNHRSEYEDWIRNLFDGVVEKRGIRNTRDTFTSSGNRRSWDSLYDDFNLANIVKAMKADDQTGKGFGGYSFFGSVNREFDSLDDIRSEKGRLQKIDNEEYENLKHDIENDLHDIASRLKPNAGYDEYSIMSDIAEAAAKYKTKDGMRRWLSQWYKVSDSDMNEIMGLIDKARNLPTGYFEAKPRRAIGFDEIASVVLPDTETDLINALESRGIPYKTYKAGDSEARKTAVNSVDNINFSLDVDNINRRLDEQELFGEKKKPAAGLSSYTMNAPESMQEIPMVESPTQDSAQGVPSMEAPEENSSEIPEMNEEPEEQKTGRTKRSEVIDNTLKRSGIFNEKEFNELVSNLANIQEQHEQETVDLAISNILNDHDGTMKKYMNAKGSNIKSFGDYDVDAMMMLIQEQKRVLENATNDEVRKQAKDNVRRLSLALRKTGTSLGRGLQAFAKWTRNADGALATAEALRQSAVQKAFNYNPKLKKDIDDVAGKIRMELNLQFFSKGKTPTEAQAKDVVNRILDTNKNVAKRMTDEAVQELTDEILKQKEYDDLENHIEMLANGMFRIPEDVENQVYDLFEQMKKYNFNSKDYVELEKKAFGLLANQIAPRGGTFDDKLDAWRYFSMLWNPLTHLRNIEGNVKFKGILGAKNTIATLIEMGADEVSKKRKQGGIGRTKAFLGKGDADLIEACQQDALDNAYRELAGNRYVGVSVGITREIPTFNTQTKRGRFLNKITDANSNALSKEDETFKFGKKFGAYKRAMAGYLKANGADASIFQAEDEASKELVNRARQYAIHEAKVATFQQEDTLGEFAKRWASMDRRMRDSDNAAARAGGRALDILMPFKTTNANILETAFAYSPAEWVKVLTEIGKLKRGTISQAEFIDHVAKSATGLLGIGAGAILRALGLIHIGDDDREDTFNKQNGVPTYGIKLGDLVGNLAQSFPAAAPLINGAAIYDGFVNKGTPNPLSSILDGLSTMTDAVTDMSMLSGLTDLLTGIRYSKSGKDMLEQILYKTGDSLLSQMFPQAGKSINNIIDPVVRETSYTDKEGWEGKLDKSRKYLETKIPGLPMAADWAADSGIPVLENIGEALKLQPKIDAKGQVMKNNGGDNVLLRFINSTLNATNINKDTRSDMDLERIELEKNPENAKTIPYIDSSTESKINKEKLSPEEWTEYKQNRGQIREDISQAFYDSDYYKDFDDSERAEIFHKIDLFSRAAAGSDYGRELKGKQEEYLDLYEDSGPDAVVEAITADVQAKHMCDDIGVKTNTVIGKDIQAAFDDGDEDLAQEYADMGEFIADSDLPSSAHGDAYKRLKWAHENNDDLDDEEWLEAYQYIDSLGDENGKIKRDELLDAMSRDKDNAQQYEDWFWNYSTIPELGDDGDYKAKRPKSSKSEEESGLATTGANGKQYAVKDQKGYQRGQKAYGSGYTEQQYVDTRNAIDTNGNNSITKAELKAYMAKHPNEADQLWATYAGSNWKR